MTARRVLLPAAGLGGAALLGAGIATTPAETLPGMLAAALFGLSVTIGAAVFVAVSGVSGARWWLPLRPHASALMSLLPLPGALLLAAFLPGLGALYPWASGEAGHFGPTKSLWLSGPFFLARAIVILLVWTGLTRLLASRLAAADRDGARKAAFTRASALFLVVLAPTLSIALFDWAMSLEPRWFSTMYGLYGFSGAFLSGIAAITALAVVRSRRNGGVSPERLHDLGKLLFAFSFFWAYIWFCQYLLVWYANLPEETPHYLARLHGGWAPLFWLVPILTFGVPFAALLGAGPKRSPSILLQSSLAVLAGRWLDSWILVGPASSPVPAFPSWYLVVTAILLGAAAALLARRGRAETVDAAARAPLPGVRIMERP